MSPDKPSLSKMKKEMGPVATLSAVVEMIINVQDYFNTTVKMSPAQIEETAEIILERWYFLRMDELKLCFRNAKAGDYGEIYNRLDGQVIMQWLMKYDEARTAVVIKANKQMQTGNIYDELQHPQIAQAVQMTVDRLRINESEVDQNVKSPRPVTEAEAFSQSVMESFDHLYNSGAGNSGAIRMVAYEGQWLDLTSYMSLRFKEREEQLKQTEA